MKWEHDCERCCPIITIVGIYNTYDIYSCSQGGQYTNTIVARFGDEGPQYISGPKVSFNLTETILLDLTLKDFDIYEKAA
jgi:hypothetical protein